MTCESKNRIERERQMQLRLDAEGQLRVVIETSPLGILTLNGEGRVLLANSSAQHLLRLTRAALRAPRRRDHDASDERHGQARTHDG